MKYLLIIPILISSISTNAEIITDGTLGQDINLSGPDFQITPDLGQQHGNNLFHSFQDFNLNSFESATFSGSNSINNIISRVTGGNPSNIDGLIRSTIPNANFYFLNPYGIMFGPNAQLDVQGSFHASTADYLRLGDNGRFDARNPSDSLLTVASVESFGFLTDSPASINTQSSRLILAPDQTLSLIGGDINIKNSQLSASSGKFNLASIAQKGEVSDSSSLLEGMITLSEHSLLDVSGAGAGEIIIQGGKLLIKNSVIQANTYSEQNGKKISLQLTETINLEGDVLAISNNTFGQGNAGHLFIDTPKLEINGSIISAGSAGVGKSGNVTIDAEQVLLKNGGSIRSDAYGFGQGGQINIKAADSITLTGQRDGNIILPGGLILEDYPSEISTDTYTMGQAGSINISTNQLNLNGGFIAGTSFGEASAGNLIIHANQAKLTNGASISSSAIANGSGGNIDIVIENRLEITGKRIGSFNIHFGDNTFEYADNQTVIAVAALSSGKGGYVSVTVPKLLISDSGVIAAYTVSKGNAGDVIISVTDLHLTKGGQINNSSGGFIGNQLAIGSGSGGDIRVNAENNITATGYDAQGTKSGIASNTLGTGKGGNIFINTKNLNLSNQAAVSANSFGIGDAGNIQLQTDNINLTDSGEITSSAIQSVGGNIDIATSTLLNSQDSEITTSVHGGVGNGGNITIGNPKFVVLNKGLIKTQADEGHGGNIQLKSEKFIASPTSLVSASSKLGLDGKVQIESPDMNLDGFLVILSDDVVEASSLMKKPCSMRGSSFTVQKMNGSPQTPYDYQAARYLSENKNKVVSKNSEEKLDFSTCKRF